MGVVRGGGWVRALLSGSRASLEGGWGSCEGAGGRGQINCRLCGGVSARRGGSVTVNSDEVCLAAGQH